MGYGDLRVFSDKKLLDTFTVIGGFAVVRDNVLTVMSERADQADRFDEEQFENTKRAAARRMREQREQLELAHAEVALRRALVNTDISTYAITRGYDKKEL